MRGDLDLATLAAETPKPHVVGRTATVAYQTVGAA
tara:strand:- start:331 stop:435 length:105 start_codon:yes stop_codon:yes gene_type:complete